MLILYKPMYNRNIIEKNKKFVKHIPEEAIHEYNWTTIRTTLFCNEIEDVYSVNVMNVECLGQNQNWYLLEIGYIFIYLKRLL